MTTLHHVAKTVLAGIPESGLLGGDGVHSLSGDIRTWTDRVFASEDGAVSAGYWRAEPGVEEWEFDGYGEIIFVLSGRMTVKEEGADPIEVGPGESAIFPVGWKGTWDVTETLSKFYVVFH